LQSNIGHDKDFCCSTAKYVVYDGGLLLWTTLLWQYVRFYRRGGRRDIVARPADRRQRTDSAASSRTSVSEWRHQPLAWRHRSRDAAARVDGVALTSGVGLDVERLW